MNTKRFEVKDLPEKYDHIAPDGSEIRPLISTERCTVGHCTLHPGGTSQAHKHRTVDETWYFIQGEGEIWLKSEEDKDHVEEVIRPHKCVYIPVGTHFQFRNTGKEPLRFLITTVPRWPGPEEAERVQDHW